ncbi:MAG: hypothetical protein Q9168_006746 [Polycauliona sp. 1 TL-2023]
MFFFRLAKDILLPFAAVFFGGFTGITLFIDDNPARIMGAHVKTGYHLTLNTTKTLAYSLPVPPRFANRVPFYSVAPSVPVSGTSGATDQCPIVGFNASDVYAPLTQALSIYISGDSGATYHPPVVGVISSSPNSHTTVFSHDSSAAQCPSTLTQTNDPATVLPAPGARMSMASPTGLVVQPHSSRNTTFPMTTAMRPGPVQHEPSSVPAPPAHDPIESVDLLASEALIDYTVQLVIGAVCLIVTVCVVLVSHIVNCQKAAEAAEFERQFQTSFANVIASSSSTRDQLNGINNLWGQTLHDAAVSKTPISPSIVSMYVEMRNVLGTRQANIASGETVPVEVELNRKIDSLNTEVSVLTASEKEGKDKCKATEEDYKELDKKYQAALTESDNLRKAKEGLESRNLDLSENLRLTKADMSRQITHQEAKVQELTLEAEVARGKISSFDTEVSELNANAKGVLEEYEILEKKYQIEKKDLLDANDVFQVENTKLSSELDSTKKDLNQQITDAKINAQDLGLELDKATAKSNELDGQCTRFSSENGSLLQVNGGLKGQNAELNRNLKASKTRCSDLVKEVDDWKAQKEQRDQVVNGLMTDMRRVVGKYCDVQAHHDLLVNTAKENEAEAKKLAENVLAEKKKMEMELTALKEKYGILAKQVKERSTSNPASSRCAPASFDDSSYQSLMDKIQEQKQEMTKRYNDSEQNKETSKTAIAQLRQQIYWLECDRLAMLPYLPDPANMPNAPNARFQHQGAPNFPENCPPQSGVPLHNSNGIFPGYHGTAQVHNNGNHGGQMAAPNGFQGNLCSPSDAGYHATNYGSAPEPHADAAFKKRYRSTRGYEYSSKK